MLQGLVALRQGRAADALPFFEALRRRGANSFELHYYLGRTYAALGRPKEAATEFAAGGRRNSAATPTRGAGSARAGWRSAIDPEPPRRSKPWSPLRRQTRWPTSSSGRCTAIRTAWPTAARVMREATRLDAGPAAYWNALGTVLGASGQMSEAERAFAEAVRREEGNGLFIYNHAIALEQLGRREDAIAQYRRAAEVGYAPARARLAQLGAAGR